MLYDAIQIFTTCSERARGFYINIYRNLILIGRQLPNASTSPSVTFDTRAQMAGHYLPVHYTNVYRVAVDIQYYSCAASHFDCSMYLNDCGCE